MGTNLRGNLLFQTEYENGEQPRGRVPGFVLPLLQRKAALAAVLENGRKGRCCNVQARRLPQRVMCIALALAMARSLIALSFWRSVISRWDYLPFAVIEPKCISQ